MFVKNATAVLRDRVTLEDIMQQNVRLREISFVNFARIEQIICTT